VAVSSALDDLVLLGHATTPSFVALVARLVALVARLVALVAMPVALVALPVALVAMLVVLVAMLLAMLLAMLVAATRQRVLQELAFAAIRERYPL
jgi:hypothetical protein